MLSGQTAPRWFGPLLVAMLVVALWPAQAAYAVQATYYAAPDGSGSTCSETDPCSLTDARDKVRTINQNMTGNIVVHLRGGTYALDSTFELRRDSSVNDSGSNGYSVIYQAYPGEQPILSGGEPISGWTLHDSAKNIYRAPVDSALRTRQLYVNGVRATRARGSLYPSGWTKTSSGFIAPDSSMSGWSNITDMEIINRVEWRHSRCGIASISGDIVTMQEPCWSSAQTPQGNFSSVTWVENAYELLDEPGEWYLNSTTAEIYYKLLNGENIATASVIAARVDKLMHVSGEPNSPISHITFKGITFAHATWLQPDDNYGYADNQTGVTLTAPNWEGARYTPGSVEFRAAHQIRLERNHFRHLGAAGVNFEHGSKNNTIIGNRFEDISGNGIQVWGLEGITNADEWVSGYRVTNNYITQIGVEYEGAVGIIGTVVSDILIDHNEITNLPYSGISVGYSWGRANALQYNNHITNNRIVDVMQVLRDGGGVYTNGQHSGSNTISGNYIWNAPNKHGAIYPDEGSSNFSISNNVLRGAPRWLYIWADSIQNNSAQQNYADTENYLNNGTNNSIQQATVVTDENWPQAAQNIMNSAGLEAAYQDIKITNLVLNKPTTGSNGTSGSNYLVDGSITGGENTKWWADTVPQWAAVDLGQTATISRWVVKHAGAAGENTIFNTGAFKLQRSDDGDTWTDVDSVSGNSADLTNRTLTPFTARYVRLYVNQANLSFDDDVRIYEFEVWGTGSGGGSPPTNVALNKPASASSEWSPDCAARKANNGSTDATDTCGGWSPNDPEPVSWWQVDLGSAYRITSLELVTRQNCCDNPSTRQDFTLQASNDPNFGSYVVLGSQGNTPLPFQATWSANVSDPNSYRYIRAVRNGYFFIAELRVFGVSL